MRYFLFLGVVISIAVITSCSTRTGASSDKNESSSIDFSRNDADKKVDVLIDGELFTSLRWPDGIYKPVLFPILTSEGTSVTRGFPLDPKPGERPDHRHHVGNWLNYGDVNGVDFWGNGHGGHKSENGGEIIMVDIEKLTPGKGEGSVQTRANWIDPNGNVMLSEKTRYDFISRGSIRIIDREMTITAKEKEIKLNDTKEGMFAIRVARQLELPSEGDITLLDAQGNATKVSAMSNEGISGDYLSSEGVTGLGVWGTRARWMKLFGNIEEEKIALVICDHPSNQSYPTYWHARGYGLFSANPLGARDFTNKKEEINFSIAAGESVTFRYRLIISANDHLSSDEIERLAKEFGQKY